jgi:hypothetical protein
VFVPAFNQAGLSEQAHKGLVFGPQQGGLPAFTPIAPGELMPLATIGHLQEVAQLRLMNRKEVLPVRGLDRNPPIYETFRLTLWQLGFAKY